MNKREPQLEALSQENSSLRERVAALEQSNAEAKEALNAIRSGSVDALVVYDDEGEKIYTITGSEHAYRILIELINEGAATVIEDGTILYCNTQFAKMLKMPMETIIGSSIYQYIISSFKPFFSALLLKGLRENCRGELSLQCKDGSSIPVMVSLNSFSADGSSGVCLIAADLTEQKKVEEEVRQEAQRAAILSDVSKSLVEAGLDDQAIVEMIARSASRLIGDACVIRLLSEDRKWLNLAAHYHPDPTVYQTFKKILTKIEVRADRGLNRQVAQTGEAVLITAEQLNAPSPIRSLEFNELVKEFQASTLLIIPIRTHNKFIGTLALIRLTNNTSYSYEAQSLAQRIADLMALTISSARLYIDLQNALQKEQTMREQLVQAEKLSAMSRMMASVVHEINNPIQAIINWLYLAKMAAPESSPLSEYLDMASSETNRISKLVSTLRIYYRKPEHESMQPVDIVKLLAEVRSILDVHISHQNVVWQQKTDIEPLKVKGIAEQLKQVFLNICMNAIEAMQPEKREIYVHARVDPDKHEIAVAVKNTGHGIDPEVLPKLFEPFFTTKSTGTGLGLAVCYEIIQHHNGRITVESQPLEGATFTVWLPAVDRVD